MIHQLSKQTFKINGSAVHLKENTRPKIRQMPQREVTKFTEVDRQCNISLCETMEINRLHCH